MTRSRDNEIALHRAGLSALGGAAALAMWVLGENWDNPDLPPPLFLALFCFVLVYSAVALALAGPVRLRRALSGALALALPVTALISLAGQRHLVATDLLDDPVTLSVAAVLVIVATPFLSVWMQDRAAWRQYAALFDASWTMTVRYAVAWIFVAVFWLLLFLSDALLTLVDITVIDLVLRTDWARFGLTGAVLGLGLAVVYEMRATISPYLILRLLRLLLPVVLAVIALFLAAVPVRGLTELFGEFSAAATLMGAAIAAITLISSALDRDDSAEVATRGLRAATRLLSLLLPLLTGLAVWAVVLRVRQYGWTPDRVLAMVTALFLLAYGLGYCASALRRLDWPRRIRSVNVAMALAVIAVAALWLTPALNVYRLSANSQVNRFEAGRSALDQLPLWQLAHDWGRPGQAGLDRLNRLSDHPDFAELAERLALVSDQTNRYQFEQMLRERTVPADVAAFVDLLELRPDGATLPDGFLNGLPQYRIEQWLAGCQLELPDRRAGCVLVLGPFAPLADAGDQGILFYLDGAGHARANHLFLGPDREPQVREVFDPLKGIWPTLPPETLSQVLDGAFDIRPSGGNALFVDGWALIPGN